MKILIHSNSPWAATGYGTQTALFAPRFQQLGHDVAVSAYYGLAGSPTDWRGIRVYPSHLDPYGADVVTGHARDFAADLVLTLCDVWALKPTAFKDLNVASWMPVDCAPLSKDDGLWLNHVRSAPIAMSRHGQKMLTDAGLPVVSYVPHGVDTAVFRPLDKAECRGNLGVPDDAFIVGVNAANKGNNPSRKAFPQQFEAFARLQRKHGDALLMLHTQLQSTIGLDLSALAESFQIPQKNVMWSDQYPYMTGVLDWQYMAAWYNACDLVSNATYGEGFGLPTVEAQACGVPVAVTNNSASAELCGAGWKVPGVPYWNAFHEAWWSAPDIDQLARVYEKAYQGEASKRRGAKAVEFAAQYDADAVTTEMWKPVLADLEAAL